MSKKINVDWCVVDANKKVLRCNRCGEEMPDGLPMDLRLFVDRTDGFMQMHKNCKPPSATP